MPGRFTAPASGTKRSIDSTSDRGMVVLETALAIPVLVAVAAALVWAVALTTTSLALADAARAAARDLARGVTAAEAVNRAEGMVPDSRLEVVDRGDAIVVVARADVTAPLPVLSGLVVPLEQQVAVPREWS
jgi:hypothetical protein